MVVLLLHLVWYIHFPERSHHYVYSRELREREINITIILRVVASNWVAVLGIVKECIYSLRTGMSCS